MAEHQEELIRLLKAVNQGLLAHIKAVLEPTGLPLAAPHLLGHVEREPGITLSELSRRSGLAKSQVSTTIESLVSHGLLEKRPDPTDQRLIRLHITEAGVEQVSSMRRERGRRLAAVIAALPPGKTEEILASLRILNAALESGPGTGTEPSQFNEGE